MPVKVALGVAVRVRVGVVVGVRVQVAVAVEVKVREGVGVNVGVRVKVTVGVRVGVLVDGHPEMSVITELDRTGGGPESEWMAAVLVRGLPQAAVTSPVQVTAA